MSCGLDDLLSDMLRDNFGTEGEEWMDSTFEPEEYHPGFVIADDPILGNAQYLAKKKNATQINKSSHVITMQHAPVTPPATDNHAPTSPLPSQPPATVSAPFVPQNVSQAQAFNNSFLRTPFIPPLAPAVIQPSHVSMEPQHKIRRVGTIMSDCKKDQKEEDKKEKKRQAVRKCREKKRREIKDLEQRAIHFDAEVKELRNQLKRARSESGIVEDMTKNLTGLEEFALALRSNNAAQVKASFDKVFSAGCSAVSPSCSQEIYGRDAILEHFQGLAAAFHTSDVKITFVVDDKSTSIIRCKWTVSCTHVAAAFGVNTRPESFSQLLNVSGTCRFTFDRGEVSDISLSYDHSQFLLQLLGIPSI